MDGEELRRRYAAGERDFTGVDLKGINISGIDPDLDIVVYDKLCPDFAADLSGINLSGADLTKAILAGANLSNANLTSAALERCNLTNTNLSGANLTKACLSGPELDGTDMRKANLLYAAISETYFAADVRGAINVNTVDFTGTPVCGLVLGDGTIIDSDHHW